MLKIFFVTQFACIFCSLTSHISIFVSLGRSLTFYTWSWKSVFIDSVNRMKNCLWRLKSAVKAIIVGASKLLAEEVALQCHVVVFFSLSLSLSLSISIWNQFHAILYQHDLFSGVIQLSAHGFHMISYIVTILHMIPNRKHKHYNEQFTSTMKII